MEEIYSSYNVIKTDANFLSERLNDALADRKSPVATIIMTACLMAREYGYPPAHCLTLFGEIMQSLAGIKKGADLLFEID